MYRERSVLNAWVMISIQYGVALLLLLIALLPPTTDIAIGIATGSWPTTYYYHPPLVVVVLLLLRLLCVSV